MIVNVKFLLPDCCSLFFNHLLSPFFAVLLSPKFLVHIAGMKTFFYPCGTFSKIATVATNRHMCKYKLCSNAMVSFEL